MFAPSEYKYPCMRNRYNSILFDEFLLAYYYGCYSCLIAPLELNVHEIFYLEGFYYLYDFYCDVERPCLIWNLVYFNYWVLIWRHLDTLFNLFSSSLRYTSSSSRLLSFNLSFSYFRLSHLSFNLWLFYFYLGTFFIKYFIDYLVLFLQSSLY